MREGGKKMPPKKRNQSGDEVPLMPKASARTVKKMQPTKTSAKLSSNGLGELIGLPTVWVHMDVRPSSREVV